MKYIKLFESQEKHAGYKLFRTKNFIIYVFDDKEKYEQTSKKMKNDNIDFNTVILRGVYNILIINRNEDEIMNFIKSHFSNLSKIEDNDFIYYFPKGNLNLTDDGLECYIYYIKSSGTLVIYDDILHKFDIKFGDQSDVNQYIITWYVQNNVSDKISDIASTTNIKYCNI